MTSHSPTTPDINEPALSPLKRAFIAMEEAQARAKALEDFARAPIAIIGLDCRVPGAKGPKAFWQLLESGTDATGPVPAGRWDHSKYFTTDPEQPGGIATDRGGFLDEVDKFDATLFGIAPREARSMDPQQRLFLETAWAALEHAGIAPDSLSGSKTSVFCGVTGSDYAYIQLGAQDPELLDAHFTSGIAHSIVSGRLSYLLGLQGPSVTLDTACSSSLVAIHQAVNSLRKGETRMAIAGGVNKILSPELFIALSRAHMLAPDGRCKTFDASADGFARGEGCGVLVMKRLQDAEKDGDRVLAVIRGSAVNQDGPSSGLTAPNGPAQEAVIKAALADAGITPDDLSYLEAHGTGTSLGDPQEMRALGNVFGSSRADKLVVGSVKTNIGHLEAAAGVIGVIKLVLMLREKRIPRHLHFSAPSPHIPWATLPVRIPVETESWQPVNERRLASVSSFGFSGTNAHIVLEEAAEPDNKAIQDAAATITLSGATPDAVHTLAAKYAATLEDTANISLSDFCRTANAGRAQLAYRATVSGATAANLQAELNALAQPDAAISGPIRSRPKVAFLFTGQGAQFAGMGRELYNRIPVFRDVLDTASHQLSGKLDAPLIDVMLGKTEDDSLLDQTRYTQPALFTLEYALYRTWQSWGIEPDLVIGHSIGEFAAACAAGILSFEDALDLVAERGRLMNTLPAGGGMMSVNAAQQTVSEYLRDGLSIAAVNAPGQIVLSGPLSVLQQVSSDLERDGIKFRHLPVSHAFHSSLMDPVLQSFERYASGIKFSSPNLRLISNLTGKTADSKTICTPAYWRDHMRGTVHFAEGALALADHGADIFVEIGPQPVLTALARETFDETDVAQDAKFLPSMRRGRNEWDQIQASLGALWESGLRADWRTIENVRGGHVTDIPTYPFARERHWVEARKVSPTSHKGNASLIGERLPVAMEADISEGSASAMSPDWLKDHQVGEGIIIPGAALLSMMSASEMTRSGLADSTTLEDIIIETPLTVAGDGAFTRIQTINHGPHGTISVNSQPAEGPSNWTRHAVARAGSASLSQTSRDINALVATHTEFDKDAFYEGLKSRGISLGPAFQVLEKASPTDSGAAGYVVLPDFVRQDPALPIHPLLLDGCLQIIAVSETVQSNGKNAFLPFAMDRLTLRATDSPHIWCEATLRTETPDMLTVDLVATNDEGEVVLEMEGVRLRRLNPMATLTAAGQPLSDALYKTVWRAQPDLPDSETLLKTAHTQAPALAQKAGLDAYDAFVECLESTCVDYVRSAFLDLGWRPGLGETVTEAELKDRLGIIDHHTRLLGRLLAILEEAGDIRRDGGTWTVLTPLSHSDPHQLEASLRTIAPISAIPEVEIVVRTQAGFADALQGKCDPLELLFPSGNTEANEALYRDVPTSVYFNGLIANLVSELAEADPALRILEVGGGTGGTTARLVERLPEGASYTFTDVGPSFVERAEERFGHRSGMRFQTLDLERDLTEQGIEAGSIDLIVGANVVHATRNLKNTLQRMKDVMSPSARLLLLEVTRPQIWFDLTVGLTPGWWTFEDTDLRTGNPLLAREDWLDLFRQVGLSDAAAFNGDPDASGCRRNQAILTASAGLQTGRSWWLVSSDAAAVEPLAEELRHSGETVSVIAPDDISAKLQQAMSSDTRPDEIVIPQNEMATLPSVLTTIQRIVAANPESRLTVLSQNGESVTGTEVQLNPQDAAVGGLLKSVPLEFPELVCRRIDIDTTSPVASIAAALKSNHSETELAIRDGKRYMARLTKWEAAVAPQSQTEAWKLVNTAPGTLGQLERQPLERRKPGSNEVEVKVEATGLNFRDVLNVLGEYPGAPPLGGECAGRVIAVGEDVEGILIGDPVVAMTAGAFASHVTLPAALTAPLPDGFSMIDGAAFAIPFVTADYCLRELGKITKGERVLIHAAAGGVGMAAMQIALAAGAEVYATAGSPQKRALVRRLGAKLVMDSRSPAFAEQILEATGGQGVDLVLNSLTGDLIDATARALKPGGRFIELGVRDVRAEDFVAASGKAFTYMPINWGHVADEDPGNIGQILKRIVSEINAGVLKPLPRHTFGPDKVTDAFRLMAQAGHLGKIVIDWNGGHTPAIHQNATYLVTGGLSGLGLDTVRWLASEGAGRIIAIGRKAASDEVKAELAKLQASGTRIETHSVDVTDKPALERLFSGIRQSSLPLRGIIHSAGTLSDAGLLQQTQETLQTVIAPKLDGLRILEELSRGEALDIFCAYSSLAAILGSPTQSNHAAANAAMGAVMQHRVRLGLPGLSIDWGPWSEIGAAAGGDTLSRLSEQGISAITPAEGRAASAYLINHASGQVAVAPIDWHKLSEWRGATQPAFAELLHQQVAQAESRQCTQRSQNKGGASSEMDGELTQRITGAPDDQKRKILDTFLEDMLRTTFALPANRKIDPDMPFGEMGLDSLLAIELRNRLGRALGRKLPATLLFESPTLLTLGNALIEDFVEKASETPAPASPKLAADSALEGLEDLSEEELDRMLGLNDKSDA